MMALGLYHVLRAVANVICIDSFGMVWHVFYENFLPMDWDTHHSMMALGLFHVLRAVANILDSFDKVAKRQEIIKDGLTLSKPAYPRDSIP